MTFDKVFVLDLIDLTKPRICVLALIMAALGFVMGSEGAVNGGRLVATLLGLGLVGAASGAFNQYLEKDVDSQMWRTLNRPLPSGRIRDRHALALGFVGAILGEIILLVGANEVTCVLGALTLLFYVGIYTPSKKITPLSTLIGAVPGALPPLMGYTAAHGGFGKLGWVLFGILFIWQIPHFLAIAWLYKEDYARAKLPILTVIDEWGTLTAKQAFIYALVLIPLTMVPTVWGITGNHYQGGAVFLGLVYLFACVLLGWKRNSTFARLLFVASIIYLPALGVLMVWDRV